MCATGSDHGGTERTDTIQGRYSIPGVEAEIQLPLKRFPDTSVSSLIFSWLTPGRASGHQKLAPIPMDTHLDGVFVAAIHFNIRLPFTMPHLVVGHEEIVSYVSIPWAGVDEEMGWMGDS